MKLNTIPTLVCDELEDFHRRPSKAFKTAIDSVIFKRIPLFFEKIITFKFSLKKHLYVLFYRKDPTKRSPLEEDHQVFCIRY